jgi:hypothetical protein
MACGIIGSRVAPDASRPDLVEYRMTSFERRRSGVESQLRAIRPAPDGR